MKWFKKQAGIAASISTIDYQAHRSLLSDTDFYITVSKRNPFEPLGQAANFNEAIEMCERDYEENK